MTDAEFQTQHDRVDKLAKRWLPLLRLDRWHVTHEYWREDAIKSDTEPLSKQTVTVMKNACDWRYMDAFITVDCREIASDADEALEVKYVHELMHCFLNECRQLEGDDWLDHEEHTASLLAFAIVGAVRTAYNRGVDEGKQGLVQ